MKQKMKQWIAYILSFCMIFSMTQFVSGSAVYAAEVADGAIDETREGDRIIRTVRYLTDTETTSTSELYLESHADRLTDFIAGTESMKWSVEFKTSATGLQALLFLERSDQYCAFYLSGGSLCFEPQKGNIAVSASASYADNQYHTAELEIQKGKAVILKMDGQVLARNTSPTMLADFSWEPTAFTIGGSKDYSKASGWKFTGSMRNVVLERSSIVPKESVWHGVNFPDTAISVEEGSDLEDKSLSMSYRLKEETEDKTTLMTFGDDGEIYADPASGKVGVKIGETTVEKEVKEVKDNQEVTRDLGTIKWHNVALAKRGSQLELYVDGSSAGSEEYSGELDLSTLQKGENVYCSWAEIYDGAISEDQAAELHQSTDLTTYPDPTPKLKGYYKGPNRDIFNAGFDGSVAYRIPAITTSRKTGTVVAAIDKRWYTSADTGVNDTVIRRSEDNGKTWGPVIPVIDMPDADAYTIDPEIVTDNDPESPHYGRIYILVDLNAYGTSLWGAVAGTGYTAIDGKQYQILNDADGNTYTIREDGIVYDDDGNVTEYRVETEAEAPYREQGSLYKDGEKIGSIYKNAELAMVDTVYMMMTYSDDDGKTWSRPKDITPEIKADWMSFFGVGPGAGVQLQHDEAHKGRLVFTMYCMRKPNANAHFSSYNVYSDDHGETWHRGGSPNPDPSTSTRELNESCIVELNNGHLIQFMKNATAEVATAVSTDGGATWGELRHEPGIREVYCEMAVLHYGDLYDPADEQTKEAIIFANPTGTTGNGRNHGRVRIAFVNDDDTLDWAYDKLIEEHNFLYNSLTLMNDGNIGMIYENEKGSSTSAAFTSFSAQYIMDPNIYENTPQPTQISVDILDASGNETETLRVGSELRVNITLDDFVFASGNVTSNVRVGDEIKEAQLIGNADNNTLVFRYTVQPEDTGDIEALAEVNVKAGGVAETIYNVPLTDKPFVTKTVMIGRAQAEGFAQLPTTGMTATDGSHHDGTCDGSKALDGNPDTIWHSKWTETEAAGDLSKHWIQINLGSTYLVSGLKYLPRSGGGNGTLAKYQIEVSMDGTTFYPYTRGKWETNGNEKSASFEYGPVPAAYVRLRSLGGATHGDASAAEIRIIGSAQTEGAANRTALVQELLKYGENKDQIILSYPQFAQALDAAEEVALDASATQDQIDDVLEALTDAAASALQELDNDMEEELTAADSKTEGDYTITSWIGYQAAVEAAEALAADASQEEKLDAYLALKNAAANLILTDTAAVAAKGSAEAKAAEALGKFDEFVQEKNGIISAGDTLPLTLDDGTVLKWSADPRYVQIDAYGRVIVKDDLEEEGDVEFTVAIFYSKGKSVTQSKSVTVKPLERRTVTFDADGGEPGTVERKIVLGKKAVKPEDPSKEGHTFAGWYLGNATEEYDFNTPVNEDITLKAKWTVNTYKLTFNTDDGTPAPEDQTITYGGKAEEPANPSKEGHTFAGWYLGSATEKYNFETPVTGNIELTARWTINTYKITFNPDGGTPAPKDQEITFGDQAQEPANPSKTGYTFAGWYQGSAAAKYDFKTPVTGKIELKAKWTANSYKVTFDPNGTGVSGMPVTMTKAYNETLTLSTPTVKAPTRSGYKFLGWSETKSGQVIPSLKVTDIVTLYAKWEEIPKESPALTKGMTETVSKMKYKVLDPDKQTVAITGSVNKSAKSLTIKDTVTINGISCKIVQIDKIAFKNCKNLTKVTIGKNVMTIEANAFKGCKNLKTITLKGNIMVKVKSNAFKGTAKNLTVKASKVKKSQRKKLQTAMRKTGGNKKLTVK